MNYRRGMPGKWAARICRPILTHSEVFIAHFFLNKLSWENDARTVVLELAGSLFSHVAAPDSLPQIKCRPIYLDLDQPSHQLEVALPEWRQRWFLWVERVRPPCHVVLDCSQLCLSCLKRDLPPAWGTWQCFLQSNRVVVFASIRPRQPWCSLPEGYAIRCGLISEEVRIGQPQELKSSVSNGMTYPLASTPMMHRNVPF
jgi:hypothetical protein